VSQGENDIEYVHIDQNDTQGPYIGGTGLIHGSHVVSAFCETKYRDKTWSGGVHEERNVP
jgi:hypothetical protein